MLLGKTYFEIQVTKKNKKVYDLLGAYFSKLYPLCGIDAVIGEAYFEDPSRIEKITSELMKNRYVKGIRHYQTIRIRRLHER